jgi:hypothetical protein
VITTGMNSTDILPGGADEHCTGASVIQYGWVCPLCRRVMSPTTMYCCFCNPPTVHVYPMAPLPVITTPTRHPWGDLSVIPTPLPTWPNTGITYTVTSTPPPNDDQWNESQCKLYAEQSKEKANE